MSFEVFVYVIFEDWNQSLIIYLIHYCKVECKVVLIWIQVLHKVFLI